MYARKKLLRRRSAPPLARKDAFFKQGTIDADLIKDATTLEIIRHPVIGSDERVHEAMSFLGYMETGGKSPFTRQQLTSAIYLRPLKNTLDARYGEHKDRHLNYEITPALESIQNWLEFYRQEPVDMAAQHELDDNDDDLVVDEDEREEPVGHANNGATFFSLNKFSKIGKLLPSRWLGAKSDGSATLVNSFSILEMAAISHMLNCHFELVATSFPCDVSPDFFMMSLGVNSILSFLLASIVMCQGDNHNPRPRWR